MSKQSIDFAHLYLSFIPWIAHPIWDCIPESPPWMLLVPLQWLHQAKDQVQIFCKRVYLYKNVIVVLEQLLFISMQIYLCSKLDRVPYLCRLCIANCHLSTPPQNYPTIKEQHSNKFFLRIFFSMQLLHSL